MKQTGSNSITQFSRYGLLTCHCCHTVSPGGKRRKKKSSASPVRRRRENADRYEQNAIGYI